MNNFTVSGILFFAYAILVFLKDKQFFPSIIFSTMWGFASLFTGLAVAGIWNTFALYDMYQFKYMNEYIIWFCFVSLSAFFTAHFFAHGRRQTSSISEVFLLNVLEKYKPIMYINFVWGIIKAGIFISAIGWDSVMDYRMGAELYMQNLSGMIGLLFHLGSYLQLFANFYLATLGLYHGLTSINSKEAIIFFILFSPPQISTGGRLFILYYILYYFGAFLIGRGLAVREYIMPLIYNFEKRLIVLAFSFLLTLVSVIAMMRSGEGLISSEDSGINKFSYVTEGILCTEFCVNYHGEDFSSGGINNTFIPGMTPEYLAFKNFVNHSAQMSRLSSVITCVITGLYLDFGLKKSLFVWFFMALLVEVFALLILKKMTYVRFFFYIVLLKIMYESVLGPSFRLNYPFLELAFLFGLFYNYIFKSLEQTEDKNVEE